MKENIIKNDSSLRSKFFLDSWILIGDADVIKDDDKKWF